MTCAGCASLGLFELRFLCVCTKPCPNGLSTVSIWCRAFGISVVALGRGACSLLPFSEKHGPTGTSYVGLGLSPLGLVAFPSQLCQAGQEFWESGTRARGMTVFFKCMQHALK